MSAPLDELRAQRALIQQHLDWLDARIAAVEGAPATESPSEPAEVPPVDATAAPSAGETAPSAPAGSTGSADAPTAAPTTPFFQIDKDAHSSTGSDIRKAQIGCFIIFIAAILGFLFLLFGLPYLVD